ncbi:lariat debranching enzyme, C-terminal domain-containing protein [Radiomyces spectabilis]|uniref:lariat debranching enzyme, C-terminal domain-containing protein n=1 Tax=Radiomyces spectabilis TaxID=64574 RepID=UPI002220B446|nr:lariat debranching enzyme, C-terminal domain-containing protein [Radiomyces spectabilis]KAI8369528.1 lariat debranching enzyme, C-terminal domain-containing protein [Radiomyces spectabilis]
MKIAIEGCCHGQLDDIYGTIAYLEEKEQCKIDLVLICGDFQAIRNEGDLQCMAVPPKYRAMGSFWKYYTGQLKAPYPTIFIGGNHEASNYMWELYHGGWVCENIYYLGNAGVINYNGIRIGGLSGIFKENDYNKGHFESSPYGQYDIKSVYHVRQYDVAKLAQIRQPMDVFLSHDWPRGVERFGDLRSLVRKKPFFEREIRENSLGSRANEELLTILQPKWWFSAHLHVHFAALVDHEKWKKNEYSESAELVLYGSKRQQHPVHNPDEILIEDELAASARTAAVPNPDEVPIDLDDDDIQSDSPAVNEMIVTDSHSTPVSDPPSRTTRFLSLDKCLPRRQFLQIVDIPTPENAKDGFFYDLEWLAITRAMHPYLSLARQASRLPSKEDLKQSVEQELLYLNMQLDMDELDLRIPSNFTASSPAFDPSVPKSPEQIHQLEYPFINPQTVEFCNLIGIENKINPHAQRFVAPATDNERKT